MKYELFQPQAIHELGQRKNQEDSIYPAKGQATAENRVFIVCDGMGGHDKGEVASAAVCSGLSQTVEQLLSAEKPFTDNDFLKALASAYDTLDAADVNHEGKMGTTMTFLCMHRGGVLVAHIGDSRIYHLRPETGEVLYRSRDHSLVQQLYELGEISYNEMKTSPRKNVILRAMQPYQEERSKAALVHITDVRPGDYFYLCSDGMLEEMEDNELMSIVGANLTDEEKVDELVRRTIDNADNHSAYLVRVKSVVEEEGDALLPNDEAEARAKNKCLNDNRKDVAWDPGDVSPVQMEEEPTMQAPIPPSNAIAGKAGTREAFLKRYLPALILLLLVLGVAAYFLFSSNGKPVVTDEDDDDSELTEQIEKAKVDIPTPADADIIDEVTSEAEEVAGQAVETATEPEANSTPPSKRKPDASEADQEPPKAPSGKN